MSHLKSAEHGGCVRWCPECEPVATSPATQLREWYAEGRDMVCSPDKVCARYKVERDALQQLFNASGEANNQLREERDEWEKLHGWELGMREEAEEDLAWYKAEVARLNAEVETLRADIAQHENAHLDAEFFSSQVAGTLRTEITQLTRECDGLRAEVERIAAERDDAREQLADDTHPSWVEAAIRDGNEVKRLRAIIVELADLNRKAVALASGGAE